MSVAPQKILAALQEAYPGSLSTNQLIDLLYAHRADGGPTGAAKKVSGYVQELRAGGHVISAKAGAGYRLEKIEG